MREAKMNISRTVEYFSYGKETYYRWLSQLAWVKRILLSLFVAGVCGIFAQIRIALPWTPVPITGQVLVVLLSGILLGNFYGGLSMACYFVLGLAGIPWFSGGKGGLPIGPTTGYLIGFVPAALFIGWAFNRHRRFFMQIGLMMIAVIIIYLFGAGHFALFMKTGLKQTIVSAVLPFIPADLIKAIIAASIGRSLLSRDDSSSVILTLSATKGKNLDCFFLND